MLRAAPLDAVWNVENVSIVFCNIRSEGLRRLHETAYTFDVCAVRMEPTRRCGVWLLGERTATKPGCLWQTLEPSTPIATAELVTTSKVTKQNAFQRDIALCGIRGTM